MLVLLRMVKVKCFKCPWILRACAYRQLGCKLMFCVFVLYMLCCYIGESLLPFILFCHRMCPIFQISNVTGENMDLLKMFLNLLSSRTNFSNDEPAEFQIDDTYSVPVWNQTHTELHMWIYTLLADSILFLTCVVIFFQHIKFYQLWSKCYSQVLKGVTLRVSLQLQDTQMQIPTCF